MRGINSDELSLVELFTLVTATVLRTRTRSAKGIKRLRDDWTKKCKKQ